ncbi:MAG: hypothetical protein R2932_40685 [Caldilineaceae bacterium]
MPPQTQVISNVIAYSGGPGVAVIADAMVSANANPILSNAIYENGKPGLTWVTMVPQ